MKNTKLIAWIALAIIAHTVWMASVAHADETEDLQQLIKRAEQGDEDAIKALKTLGIPN